MKHDGFEIVCGRAPDHQNHSYYSKIIHIDRSRVEARFRDAPSRGIAVHRRILSGAGLRRHLRCGPAILLVDGGALACDLCNHNKLRAELRSCFGGSYKGHYILVVGFTGSRYLYRDPALSPRVCAARLARLHRAAAAHGTDDDCILYSP